MRLFTHTIWIADTPEAVFDYFLDFSRASRWRSYVRSMVPVQPGPLRPGSRIRVTLDLLGAEHSYDMVVLAIERPSLWRHRSDESDFDGYVEYTFDAEGTGTRARMSMEVTPRTLYGWLGLPLMLVRRRRTYIDQLPQLKRAVEGDSGDAA